MIDGSLRQTDPAEQSCYSCFGKQTDSGAAVRPALAVTLCFHGNALRGASSINIHLLIAAATFTPK